MRTRTVEGMNDGGWMVDGCSVRIGPQVLGQALRVKP